MKGEEKTREQFIDELVKLRRWIAELEASEAERESGVTGSLAPVHQLLRISHAQRSQTV